jgi:hypothetical protein
MSKVPKPEVGDSEVSSVHLDRVQGVLVSERGVTELDTKFDSPLVAQPWYPPSAQAKDREVVALETAAAALTGISNFLSGITLKEVIQHQAVHGSIREILGGLATKDGRGALDARTMNQNAIDMAYLIEKVLGKVTSHAISRTGAAPEVKDGEELMGVKEESK